MPARRPLRRQPGAGTDRAVIRPLYHWTLRLAGHKRALWALAGISFIESSVFPIPPDVMLVPMALAERARALWFAAVCTIASVLGGLAGYAIGALLFELAARPLLDLYGYWAAFGEFKALYAEHGAWIVIIAGVTPFPYKVITIASGAVSLDIAVFVFASMLARGLRFFVVAGLLYYFGAPVRRFIERYLEWLAVVFLVLLVGGFVALKFLF